MEVGFSVHGFVGNRYLADKGVCEEAAGKNCGVCFREADIRSLYRLIEYREFQ